MTLSRHHTIFNLLIGALLFGCSQYDDQRISIDYESLSQGFIIPPDSVKPWCYWYWINDDISKEGVTKDLEAMKEFGIGAALIGNINPDEKDGRVPLFSEEWWEVMVHAVNEGKRLGVDIGFFNCPGWSQSGGPWVTAEMAMRYTVYSMTTATGGQPIKIKLEEPINPFQDTYVMAVKSNPDLFTTQSNNTSITSSPSIQNTKEWIDGDLGTFPVFDTKNKQYVLDIQTDETISARSISIAPGTKPVLCDCKLEVEKDTQFELIRAFTFDRSNTEVSVGAAVQGPLALTINAPSSNLFRLTCDNFQGNTEGVGFAEIALSEEPVLEQYIEKQLAKMHPTPFPKFTSYLWETQPEVSGTDYLASNDIINISDKMDSNGQLNWEAPEGNWKIYRFGLTPTGTRNSPAAPQGKGYEIDKMSEELIRFHFEQFIGELLKRIPKESKSAFKYVIGDSYEMGSQNWTDGFASQFKETYGYDPIPYLPVYAGKVVQSVEHSERFLWDIRRLVADKVAYEYVGGLKKISNENNLKLWLENYGHWGFPSEFLMYGGQSDLVSGEFWNEGTLGDIECKASSSAAHIYGKPITSAEAFTAAGLSYLRHPAVLKKRGDWSLTEGVNHFVLHLYIQQPDETRVPGVNAFFSTEFNRKNTWFVQAKTWVDYLRRCQHMLTKGLYSADVCYFIGENTPIMTGTRNPELPNGYSYDYINAEALLTRVSVENGRLMFPDGLSYGLMVLPPLKTMRPEVLAKIQELVKAGAKIYGKKPMRSPSLENFPIADEQLTAMANDMWGTTDESKKLIKSYGKGMIMNNMPLQEALDHVNLKKDLIIDRDSAFLWTHRSAPNTDIYFITNQSGESQNVSTSFRVVGRVPQLWDAVTGEIRALPVYTESDGYTTVSLSFAKDQSFFIVFAETTIKTKYESNFPPVKTLTTLDGNWVVNFNNKDIGPKAPVVMDKLNNWTTFDTDSIKYYSGTADYTTTFTMDNVSPDHTYQIDLGNVSVIATVTINGNEVGTTWIKPFVLDISDALVEGENKLEIKVANLWRNRLIKDKMLAEEDRYTWVSVEDIKPKEAPHPAGLLGPVTISVLEAQ